MAIDPAKVAGAVRGVFGGTPPAGMSPLFWETINNSEEAEAIRRSSKDINSKNWGQSVRGELDNFIAKKWAEVPEARKQQWAAQDKSGSKNVPGSQGWQEEQNLAEAEGDTGVADIDAWAGGVGNISEIAQQAASGDLDAIEKLKQVMGSIKDPEIQKYIGDYIAQGATAGPSQQAIADQRKEYQKISGLTDPTITAEERLMQMTARREQENQLKAQRGAFAKDLQARGVYGSGAELTMNLAASQEGAQRRAYDEMAAQAHAQERASDMLKKAAEISGNIRTAETQEEQYRATAADRAKEFNNELRTAYDKWVTEEQGRQNKVKTDNAATVAEFQTGANQSRFRNAAQTADTGLAGVKAKIDARNLTREAKAKARSEIGRIFTYGEKDDEYNA